MPKRLFVYDSIDPDVDLKVPPIQMRWTEWEDALGMMLSFYENFDAVGLLFAVHNNTGGTIARGLLEEFGFTA